MKRYLLSGFLILAALIHADAQKLMTRTGKIDFYSHTAIEDIKATNNEVAVVLEQNNGNLAIIIPIKSFRFEKALMQEHFNENYMESDQFPRAEFKGVITDISKVSFSKDGDYPVQAQGKMTIHNVTKSLTIPGTIRIKDNQVTLISRFKVSPKEYGITIPSVTSSKIAEKVEVSVNCRLNK